MSLEYKMKRPADILDYDVRFDQWLEENDRIAGWVAKIENSTAVIDRGDYADQSVRLWISGGDDGDSAFVDITITTALGRKKSYCFRLRIRECH